MILLIGLILVIGMLLAFFYPPIFILYYGMLGSMYDARGIAGYFSKYLYVNFYSKYFKKEKKKI